MSSGRVVQFLLAATMATMAGGCGKQLSTPAEVKAFELAAHRQPTQQQGQVEQAINSPYRLAKGDLLELHMPQVLQAANIVQPQGMLLGRVNQQGQIMLPEIGMIDVAGSTVQQIEERVVGLYHGRLLKDRPLVVARVADYTLTPLAISGGVRQAGVYGLRGNEMSLTALLNKAGGISSQGAQSIRIIRDGSEILVAVHNGDRPQIDAALREGDRVDVQSLCPQVLSVMGLVNRPGTFPYPAGARYNLAQALALAGGTDVTADPHTATIFRPDGQGGIVSATFPVGASEMARTSKVEVCPGDVVQVDSDLRTTLRRFVASVLRISTGAYMGATYELNPEK